MPESVPEPLPNPMLGQIFSFWAAAVGRAFSSSEQESIDRAVDAGLGTLMGMAVALHRPQYAKHLLRLSGQVPPIEAIHDFILSVPLQPEGD